MKKSIKLIVVIWFAQLLTGCGLKGPLYMPDHKPPTKQHKPAQQQTNPPAPQEQNSKQAG